MIQIKNISVQLGQQKILDDLSFEVQAGEFLVLLGKNGAGKSFLLKTLAKSVGYQQGRIDFLGKKLQAYQAIELSQKRAVLSQNVRLVFPMKVLDLVLLGRFPHTKGGYTAAKDIEIACKCLELMGMTAAMEQDVLQLSGGEQQRVHLARVLAQIWEQNPNNPQLLLLDEPTSNLDIVYQHILLNFLEKSVQNKGLAVITVLHDMNLAARYANKIALLKKGSLVTIGSPSSSLTSEHIQTTFGVESIIHPHPKFDCLQVSTY